MRVASMSEKEDLLLRLLEQLRDEFHDEREASRASRKKLHERVDALAEDVGAIRGDIRILGAADSQIRAEVQALKQTVEDNQAAAQPTIDEWRRIRAIGIGIVGLLALGGMSVGAAFVWTGEAMVSAVRHWLRLP